jgi:signal peptidase II
LRRRLPFTAAKIHHDGARVKIKYLLLATVSGAIIAADQLTKIYIHTHFHLGESHTVISSFFDITYVRNFGAAFGFFATLGRNFREPFFVLVPIFAFAVIIFIMRTTLDSQKIQILSLSFIFGGAIGNYIDRLRFQYVIDFIDIHWKEVYHWPAFNVADMAIVSGITILLYRIIIHKDVPRALVIKDSAS